MLRGLAAERPAARRRRAVSVRPQEVRARAAAAARGGAGAIAEAARGLQPARHPRGARRPPVRARRARVRDRRSVFRCGAGPRRPGVRPSRRVLPSASADAHAGSLHRIRRRGAGRGAGHEPNGILVSGGGGRFAGPLYLTAIDAHRRLAHATGLTIVAGPLCDEPAWRLSSRPLAAIRRFEIRRSVTDLSARDGGRAAFDQSVRLQHRARHRSRGRAGARRAVRGWRRDRADRPRAAARGAGRSPGAAGRPPERDRPWPRAIEETLAFEPARLALDLDGADGTARLVRALVRGSQPAGNQHMLAR